MPMDLTGKTAAVTGGARGIGRAIAEALHEAGAKVAVADLDGDAAQAVGAACGGFGARVDVANERETQRFLMMCERTIGAPDIFVANAGVGVGDGPVWTAASAPDDAWELCWRINVMAGVHAARHLIPVWAKKGSGTFVMVASAAGLLNQIGDAAYSATKHAAVSFAESMAIRHAGDGVAVHCVCPEGVRTDMTKDIAGGVQGLSGYKEPADVAKALLSAMAEKRFFAFSHDTTAEYYKGKAAEPDRWIGGMRKLYVMLVEQMGRPF